MALPVFKSVAINTPTTSTTSQTVVVPTGTGLTPLAGDVILFFVAAAAGPTSGTSTPPAAFTELTPAAGATGYSSRAFWKLSDGTEGGTTLTWTNTTNAKRPLIVAVYGGVSGVPIAVQSNASQGTASTSHPSPASTSTAADQLEVTIGMDAVSAGATQTSLWTFPSPLTKRASVFTPLVASSSMSLADSGTTPVAAGAALGSRAVTADIAAIGTSWTILLASVASALTASLTVSPTFGTIPFTVTATATASGGTGTVKNYAFVWGDGATTPAQVGVSATHSYTSSGSYTVTVTVTNT